MKRELQLISFFLLINLSLFAQTQKAQLTDFRFIVNDTQEFPNYFEDEALTKRIYEKALVYIREKVNLETIVSYQAKDIEYRFSPPFRDNLNLIEKKNFDYYIAITSVAGVNTDINDAKTYTIHLKTRIESIEDTVFINTTSASFKLTFEESALYDEAVISKKDFENLYLNVLKNTFSKKEKLVEKEFKKPGITAYNGFMKKANQFVLKQEDRILSKRFFINQLEDSIKSFQIKEQATTINGTIRVQDVADILRFQKIFNYRDFLNKKRLSIRADYEEATDFETNVRYIKSTKLQVKNRRKKYTLEFYPDKETSWVYTLDWQTPDSVNYALVANRYTNYVEIFSKSGLLTIVQLPASGAKLLEIENRKYTFYNRKNLTQQQKAEINQLFAFFLMANEFMSEVNLLRQGS